MSTTIRCTWEKADCVNAEKRRSIFDPVRCIALKNCDFPKRGYCPFYKPRKEDEDDNTRDD